MGIGKNPVGDFGPMIEQAQNLKEPNSLHWAVIINPTEFTEESMKFKPKQKNENLLRQTVELTSKPTN